MSSREIHSSVSSPKSKSMAMAEAVAVTLPLGPSQSGGGAAPAERRKKKASPPNGDRMEPQRTRNHGDVETQIHETNSSYEIRAHAAAGVTSNLGVDSGSTFSPILPGPTSPLGANDERACPGLFTDAVKDTLTRSRPICFDGWGANARMIESIPLSNVWSILRVLVLGNLISSRTDVMGVSETLVATLLVGVVYSMLSKQPLILVGMSGPMAVFVLAVHATSNSISVDFLSWWSCIGLWCSGTLFLLAATNACRLTSLFPTFGWEILRAFTGLAFFWESIDLLIHLFNHPDSDLSSAFFSLWLASASFVISLLLSGAKDWLYLTKSMRNFLSSYCCLIALILFTVVQSIPEFSKVNIPHVRMHPSKHPNSSARLLSFVSLNTMPKWATILAALPGSFLALLIFIDHNFTALLLKKSLEFPIDVGTRSWDLLLLSFSILFCSLFGLPFVYGLFYPSKQVMDFIFITRFDHDRMDEESLSRQSNWFRLDGWRTSCLLSYAILALSLIPAFRKVLTNIPHGVLIGLLSQMGCESLSSLDMIHRVRTFLMDKSKADRRMNAEYPYNWMSANFTLIQVMGTVTVFAIALSPMGIFYPFVFFLLVLFYAFCLGSIFNHQRIVGYRNPRSNESGGNEILSVGNHTVRAHPNPQSASSNNIFPVRKEPTVYLLDDSSQQHNSSSTWEGQIGTDIPYQLHHTTQPAEFRHSDDSIQKDDCKRFENIGVQKEMESVLQRINRVRSEPPTFIDMDGKKRVRKREKMIRPWRNDIKQNKNRFEKLVDSRLKKNKRNRKKENHPSLDCLTASNKVKERFQNRKDEDESYQSGSKDLMKEEDSWTYIYSNSVYSPDLTPMRSKSLDIHDVQSPRREFFNFSVADSQLKYASGGKRRLNETGNDMGETSKSVKNQELNRWVEESWKVLQYNSNFPDIDRQFVARDDQRISRESEIISSNDLSCAKENEFQSKFSLNINREMEDLARMNKVKSIDWTNLVIPFSPVSSHEGLWNGEEYETSSKPGDFKDDVEYRSVSIRGQVIPAVSSIIQRLRVDDGQEEATSTANLSAEKSNHGKGIVEQFNGGYVSKDTTDGFIAKKMKCVDPSQFIQESRNGRFKSEDGHDSVQFKAKAGRGSVPSENLSSSFDLDDGNSNVSPQRWLSNKMSKMNPINWKPKS